MISEKLSKMLSDQINAEYHSAYIYLSMSAYAEDAGFGGIANWMFQQVQEEMAHGTRMYQYLLERGGKPEFPAIEAPPTDFTSIQHIFEMSLAHEQYVTSRINAIATAAMEEHDHALYQFIMWFVNEQVEEEATASEILGKVEMIGDNKALLLALDKELSARVFVNPFTE